MTVTQATPTATGDITSPQFNGSLGDLTSAFSSNPF
jgi:hypothetical protein